MSYTKDVFDIEADQEVGCYFCIQKGCHASYFKGMAFLAGPDHTPHDGNANYICIEHLDDDAVLPDTYPADYVEVTTGRMKF